MNKNYRRRNRRRGLNAEVAVVAVWLFWVVLVLAAWAGIGYVAWHFISKFW